MVALQIIITTYFIPLSLAQSTNPLVRFSLDDVVAESDEAVFTASGACSVRTRIAEGANEALFVIRANRKRKSAMLNKLFKILRA